MRTRFAAALFTGLAVVALVAAAVPGPGLARPQDEDPSPEQLPPGDAVAEAQRPDPRRDPNKPQWAFGLGLVQSARPYRPAFSPGSAVHLDAGIEVLAFLRRDRRLILRGEARIEWLADEIVDSPIVDDRQAPTAFVALAWSL